MVQEPKPERRMVKNDEQSFFIKNITPVVPHEYGI